MNGSVGSMYPTLPGVYEASSLRRSAACSDFVSTKDFTDRLCTN